MYRDREGNPITMEEWTGLFKPAYNHETGGADEYRTIGREVISDEITVSTVWLGLDHNFMPGSPPAIFETMVFGGKHDMWQDRYATKEAALAGHERVVAALQNGESPGE